MSQTFGQILSDWLQKHRISVVDLSSRMRLGSRNSVYRLLSDQSSPAVAERFFLQMKQAYSLTPGEEAAFQSGLNYLKYAPDERLFLDGLHEVLTGNVRNPVSVALPFEPSQAGKITLYVIGCNGTRYSEIIRSLLSEATPPHKNFEVLHLIRQEDPEACHPDALIALEMISDPRYRLYLGHRGLRFPCSAMFLSAEFSEGERAWYLALPSDTGVSFSRLEDVTALPPVDSLFGEEGSLSSFYSDNSLSSSVDYVSMLKESFRREKNRACHIVKLTPPLQMIPDDILSGALRGVGNRANLELLPSLNLMKTLCFQRFRNYTQKTAQHSLILGKSETEHFFRTGRLADHPNGFRPFTRDERLRILRELIALSEKEHFSFRLATGNINGRLSFEIYPKQGVLIFPSHTCYRTKDPTFYREVFWPGEKIANLFMSYRENWIIPRCCEDEEQSRDFLLSLQRKLSV